MNKKLLIAAVGAALVAGPVAVAQAGTTLYGHIHMSFDRFDTDRTTGYEDGMLANNSSRFGIKGDEDLGGGLKAIYQIESNIINIDEGTGGLAGTNTSTSPVGTDLRNSFIGFAGSWGTVKVGRHDTSYKDLGRKLDNFNEQVGDMRTMIGDKGAFDKRVSNMVRYDSPSFAGGWQGSMTHTSNNGSDAEGNSAVKDNSISVTWSAGPIYVGLGWNEQGTASGTNEPSGTRLLGSYSFNDIVLGLFWESMSDIGGTSGHDRDAMGLIASMKMGNNKFKFHWVDADKYDDVADTGGTLWAVGVDHSFSKNVVVYLNYASVDNDSAATFNTASSGGGHDAGVPSTSAGKSPTAYSLGAIVKF